MDGQRFDDVAKLMGTGASRRRVLAALMASAGGGLLGAFSGGQNRAAAGCIPGFHSCVSDADCCTPAETCFLGACGDSSTCGGVADESCGDDEDCCGFLSCPAGSCQKLCQFGGETCSSSVDCCADLGCDKSGHCGFCLDGGGSCGADGDCCGSLVCDSGSCVAQGSTCIAEGESCGGAGGAGFLQGFDECCEGLACMSESLTCEPLSTCGIEGDECPPVGAFCCEHLICKHAEGEPGICVLICGVAGDACVVDLDCCLPDFVCNTGTGFCEAATAPTCSVEGDDCANDSDCCDGICCGGSCHDIECCIEDDDPNARCDDGETCFEGVCDSDDTDGETPDPDPEPELPTTLPSTGVGNGNGDFSGLIGLGFAAGTAAFVAAKRMRRDSETAGDKS